MCVSVSQSQTSPAPVGTPLIGLIGQNVRGGLKHHEIKQVESSGTFGLDCVIHVRGLLALWAEPERLL